MCYCVFLSLSWSSSCWDSSSCHKQSMDKPSFSFHLYLHVDSSSFGLYHYVVNLQYVFVWGKWSILQKMYVIYFLFFQLQSVLAALIDWIWMSYNVSSPVLYYYLCDVLIFVLWSETTMKQYWRLFGHCQWWLRPLDTVDTEDAVSRDIQFWVLSTSLCYKK